MFYSIRQIWDRDQDRQNRKDAALEAARQEAESFSFGPRHKFTNTRLGVPMTTDIKAALTEIAETNCNIIGLTCAAAVDHIEELETKSDLSDDQVWKLVNGVHSIFELTLSRANAITSTRKFLAEVFKGAA